MIQSKKFTTEELDQIQKLRDKNQTILGQFGQIEIELILARQRYESLAKEKDDLNKQFLKFQGQEKELVEELNKKYGTGTVNLESGEFTPAKW